MKTGVASSVNVMMATFFDLDEIMALEDLSFACPWKREYFATEVGAPFRFNLVARDRSGKFLGYAFCAFAGGEMHIHKIAVTPSERRRGIALALMDDVLRFARETNVEEIYLEVRPSNQAARRLYETLGFKISGKRKDYYADGEDALTMVKLL